MTLAEIRAQYPDAGSVSSDAPYCVGGALCLANLSNTSCFPSPEEIALALCAMRPTLSSDESEYYAVKIIHANDAGRIDEAWAIAAEAVEGR